MKRILSCALVAIMLLVMLPAPAHASSRAATVTSTGTPAISIDSTYGKPGGTVDVYVDLTNNPGITSAKLSVSFDEQLTLIGAENGDAFSALSYMPPNQLENGGAIASSCQFAWFSADIADENIKDGIILKLTFRVSEDAQVGKKYSITVSGDDVVDKNLNEFTLKADTKVAVIDYTPGNVNDDNSITMLDVVLLCRYIVDGCKYDPDGYGVRVNESASNVNDDGKISMLDVVLLCRYIVDGCTYDPDGYAIKLLPETPKCSHTMEAVSYKAATCTEDGNISYYHCTTCGKYYNDSDGTAEIALANTVLSATGHTAVTDPYVEPTYTSVGWTEGSHCSVCSEVLVAQEEIPVLNKNEYVINYKLPSNDTYLTTLNIVNSNPTAYTSEDGVDELVDLEVAGYDFYGWYTEPNGGGTRMNKIAAGTTGTVTLYAYMEAHVYTVTYRLYRTPVEPIADTYKSYTVDKGLIDLPNPDIYNYVFLGWYLDDGTEVTQIPTGTTGDITLNAYWTSKRNLAKTAGSPEDPIIIEDIDNGVIYFAYELGTIENVPLSDAIWTIQSVSGLAQQKSETVSIAISETRAAEISKTISNTTVDSTTWTLAEDWNEETSVSEEWAEQNGMTVQEANTQTKTESGTYSVTDSNGGSKTTTETDGTTTLEYKSQNYTHGNGAELGIKISGSYSAEVSADAGVASAKAGYTVGGEISGQYSQQQETNEHTGTDTTTVDSSVQSDTTTWNKASTSSATKAASESVAVTEALSSIISSSKGYGSSYATGGESSESQGFSSTDSQSTSTSTTLTYFTSETTATTTTYSTDGKSEGCYRLVIAGTVHVFGVVGYDVATQSYFTYTFNILDDKTYEFLDYSPDLSFNDYENCALPFEIPYFVHAYVESEIVCTEGLTFKTNTTNGTATVRGYSGSDTDVVIPSYISSGGTAYKVTSISASAFAGTSVEAIVLSKFITEIPAGAFKNCTALKQVSGYFTVIGDEAFSGCTSLESFTVSSKTTSIGTDAFKNVPSITVNVLNENAAVAKAKTDLPYATEAERVAYARQYTQKIVDAALAAGAQSAVLDISKTIDGVEFAIEVGEIASFELLGGKRTYRDMQISSASACTILRELTIKSSKNIPLMISSNNLALEVVNVESQGYALLLSGDAPCITLIRDNYLTATSGDAVVCKAPEIVSKTVNKAVGTILISGNMYVNGTTEDVAELNASAYLDVENGEIILISNEQYAQYIKGAFYITFNANGGVVEENSRLAFCGSMVGTLPTPVRAGYDFVGWFTEDGIQVTETTSLASVNDITLTAKWSAMAYSVSWNTDTGYTIAVIRTSSPYANAITGALSNGAVVYYGDVLSVTYSASTGYSISSKGSTSVTVVGNVTSSAIYATATVNSYTVDWDTGTGYSVAVSRTSSPNEGAATGSLSSGETVYYGDILSVTYTAIDGYSLVETGASEIIVSGNVGGSEIYATAVPNSYTYNVVYKSSNGTDLGSTTVTFEYGTTNTVCAPAKAGYDTPDSQDVIWDSVSGKTITFIYVPTAVAATTKSGNIYAYSGSRLAYDVTIDYQNRTADSVQIRVTWTSSLVWLAGTGAYNSYGQSFRASVGSVGTGNVTLSNCGTWSGGSYGTRSVTNSSGWITIPLSTTDATTVDMNVYYFQTNYNGTDMTSYGEANMSTTWSISLPAY